MNALPLADRIWLHPSAAAHFQAVARRVLPPEVEIPDPEATLDDCGRLVLYATPGPEVSRIEVLVPAPLWGWLHDLN